MTEDIDLLIDSSPENVVRIKKALECLPDQASREVLDTDVKEYIVVRINDEITVDLMGSACGVNYEEASTLIDWREIRGIRVPVASAHLLWKTKQTYRKKMLWTGRFSESGLLTTELNRRLPVLSTLVEVFFLINMRKNGNYGIRRITRK